MARARMPKPARAPPRRRRKANRGNMESSQTGTILLPKVTTSRTTFVRTTVPVLLTKVSSDPAAMLSFRFDEIPNYTEFTAMYDYYRILRIDFKVTAVFNAVVTTKLFVTSDFDGGAVLSLADMAQRRHVERILSVDKPEFVFSFRPKVSSAVNASTGSVLSGVTAPLLDLASPTVEHYGLAYNMLNYNTGISGVNIYTSAVFHVQLSGAR